MAHLGASRSPKMHPGIRNVEVGVPSSAQLVLVRFWARVALWPLEADKVLFLALCAPLYCSNIFLRDFLQKSIAPQPSAAARPPAAASCGGRFLLAFQSYRKCFLGGRAMEKEKLHARPAQPSPGVPSAQPSQAQPSPAQPSTSRFRSARRSTPPAKLERTRATIGLLRG